MCGFIVDNRIHNNFPLCPECDQRNPDDGWIELDHEHSERLYEYQQEFQRWFQYMLRHKLESCYRDVFSGAKGKLREEYIKMCVKQEERDVCSK